jgi:hypothetical protein
MMTCIIIASVSAVVGGALGFLTGAIFAASREDRQ